MNDILLAPPAVFAVGNDYQIIAAVAKSVLFAVRCGQKTYYDHSNGILRSDTRFHKVALPASVLDREKSYTVICTPIVERKPYYTETSVPIEASYDFIPLVKKDDISIIHISDTHGLVKEPVEAARRAGACDMLILNGDIQDHSGKVENFDTVFLLAGQITGGRLPCIFSRGNHDLRGICAEKFAACVPNCNGKSYYTFRTGCVWGLVLDCGEDKDDTSCEYGNTICCHAFREEETEFLKDVALSHEYDAEGILYKLVIAHNPFTYTLPAPFNIEQPMYSEWIKILGESIKPTVMLSGHLHTTEVSHSGGRLDTLGQPCDVIVGSRIVYTDNAPSSFVCAHIKLSGGSYEVEFI